MKITVDLPDYDGNGLDIIWENEAYYTLDVYESTVVFSANKQALISFAKQMLYMAYNDLPIGSHIHFDEFFTKLHNLNYEFIIEKCISD